MPDEKKKINYPGLSDKAYMAAVRERNRRTSKGLKCSIASIVSEAVIRVFGNS